MGSNVPLKCKYSTTGTAGSPEGEVLPLIILNWLFCLEVLPQKTKKWSVFGQQSDLVEHKFDNPTDGKRICRKCSRMPIKEGSRVGAGSEKLKIR